MISRERLQELIEKEETVWCISELWGDNKLKLHNKDVKDSDCFHISKTLLLSDSIEFYDEEETYRVPFQLLFETQQEYLNHKEELDKISKTETLTFPAYKEVLKDGFDKSFFIEYDNQIIQYYFLVSEIDNKIQFFFREIEHVMLTDAYDCTLELPLTEENYKRACKLVTKFFTEEYNLSNIGDQE